MRLPYSWLRDVVQAGAPGWDVSPYELENTLIRIGHEVEDVIPVGPVTGPLTVGRVVEFDELTEFKKPIRAVKVDVGEPETRDIVCGATNFAVGDLVVVALPGTVCQGISRSPRARPMPHLRRDDLLDGRTQLGH
jgi:phenylalanyl-tRNA synthetase beta chain